MAELVMRYQQRVSAHPHLFVKMEDSGKRRLFRNQRITIKVHEHNAFLCSVLFLGSLACSERQVSAFASSLDSNFYFKRVKQDLNVKHL